MKQIKLKKKKTVWNVLRNHSFCNLYTDP